MGRKTRMGLKLTLLLTFGIIIIVSGSPPPQPRVPQLFPPAPPFQSPRFQFQSRQHHPRSRSIPLDPPPRGRTLEASGTLPSGHPHPLDPLDPTEIRLCKDLISNDGRTEDSELKFIWITLQEPLKSQMLPCFLWGVKPSLAIPRRAKIILLIKDLGELVEVIVDIRKNVVESWERIDMDKGEDEEDDDDKDVDNHHRGSGGSGGGSKGREQGQRKGQGTTMATLDEAEPIIKICKGHPEIQERLEALGVKDFDLVVPTPSFYGFKDQVDLVGKNIVQVSFYLRNESPIDNYNGNPLDFIALVDTLTMEVLRLEDLPIHSDSDIGNREGASIPPKSHNYDPELLPKRSWRKGVNPILINQPAGPSFSLKGNSLSWQKFDMRIGFNSREGLVLNHINYKDKTETRPLIYRAAMSEIAVSYGDPRPGYNRLMSFDEGQYGLGQRATDLKSRHICKDDGDNVRYLDFPAHTMDGVPILIKNAICIYEEDSGEPMWTKLDAETGRSVTVQSTRLAISFLSTVGENEYIFVWYFYQDARIRMEVKVTGTLHTVFVANGANSGGHGSILAHNVNAPYHEYLFGVRIDTEFDGSKNSVVSLDTVLDEDEVGSDKNLLGNGFSTKETLAKTAEDGRWKSSAENSRSWLIYGNGKNSLNGSPKGWQLQSDSMPPLLLKKDSPLHDKAGFADYNLWVTPYKEGQLYAAGMYLNEGLPKWLQGHEDESIRNTDIVLWHTFGFTKIPCFEDFPVMSTQTVGFWLKPWNFFKNNPSLDVPSILSFPVNVKDEL